ncbi:hypothetical protein VP5_051 [Vibrio virus VPMCC5]|nr:hypothetical protein VP5_051 [Vibrio virus VPMCC5]
MGKPKHSPRQAAKRRNNWLIHKIKFAKQELLDNLNKRQKKEYHNDGREE